MVTVLNIGSNLLCGVNRWKRAEPLHEMFREFQKHGPWTNHDVHAHRRAKNNRKCHDACAHCWVLTSPVTPSILLGDWFCIGVLTIDENFVWGFHIKFVLNWKKDYNAQGHRRLCAFPESFGVHQYWHGVYTCFRCFFYTLIHLTLTVFSPHLMEHPLN